ncbi:MAG: hypothetical protein ACI4R9_00845 [Kiritimatiellia bacterium]
MNRNKIIMAALGGVALAVVLVFGGLAYSAWSEQRETRERIASERSNANRILSSAIPPTQASLDGIGANTKLFADWRGETHDLLVMGDIAIDRDASATAFKATMAEDARMLEKLPGGADGRIVRDGFDFGFKSYIIAGDIPAEATLPALKRQWAEIKAMVELLAACGIVELQSLEVAPVETKAAPPPERPKKGFGSKKAAQPVEVRPAFETMGYTVRFTARPLALVKVLNAFATAEHLMYIEDLAFVREKDMLGEMLGAGKKEQESGARRGRRRGRRTEEQPPAEGEGGEEVARKGLVTDPQLEAPFVVTLRIRTFDFGTNGAAAPVAADKAEEKEDEE